MLKRKLTVNPWQYYVPFTNHNMWLLSYLKSNAIQTDDSVLFQTSSLLLHLCLVSEDLFLPLVAARIPPQDLPASCLPHQGDALQTQSCC